MDIEAKKKMALGEIGADVAEFWFKLMGFVAVTGVFHAAAEKTEMPVLIAVKWICYVNMGVWLQYKIDKATWFLFPSTDPTNKAAKSRHLSIAVAASATIASIVYQFIAAIIEILLKVKGAG